MIYGISAKDDAFIKEVVGRDVMLQLPELPLGWIGIVAWSHPYVAKRTTRLMDRPSTDMVERLSMSSEPGTVREGAEEPEVTLVSAPCEIQEVWYLRPRSDRYLALSTFP